MKLYTVIRESFPYDHDCHTTERFGIFSSRQKALNCIKVIKSREDNRKSFCEDFYEIEENILDTGEDYSPLT